MTDVTTIAAIDRSEMVDLATTEYSRLFELLDSLDPSDWDRQTVCDDWTVQLMVAHLLGAAEGHASLFENTRQLIRGRRWAKAMGRELVDGINAVQVMDRNELSPAELVERLRKVAQKAVSGRRRTPAPMRRVKIPTGFGYAMSMGHLVDAVYTRDQWMHRIDISETVGKQPEITADQDGRIIADVVREWHSRHGEPFELILGGPAGGQYRAGTGGPRIEIDAVEFCLVVSGRLDKDMELRRLVVF